MANETIVDGEVTFHGDVAGIATFVRMNNSFLAYHPKAKDKGVGYYTNLFTEDGRFLIDESEIAQYLKKSKTFVLAGCGRNNYTTNIEYQLKWLLSGLKNYYFCNQTYLEEEVAKNVDEFYAYLGYDLELAYYVEYFISSTSFLFEIIKEEREL